MKRLATKFFFIIILSVISFSSKAQMVSTSETYMGEKKPIKITGFINYPPFGYMDKEYYRTVFEDFWKSYSDKYGFNINLYVPTNYNDNVIGVRTGYIDFILGMYNQTDIYNGIEYVYPAAINNPIHIITMPYNTEKIKNIKDAKGLKGAIYSEEPLSDYIKKYLKDLDIQVIDNTYDMFKLLYKKEIDYIIGSQYFYRIEATKLGIQNQISYSKKPVWNMPMFFGVSKVYEHRALIIKTLADILKSKEAKEKINNYLIQIIHNIENEYSGVVPPDFANQ